MLLVAPPNGVTDFPEPAAPCTVDAFAGERDEFVDPVELAQWKGARLHIVADSDHFFGRSADSLRKALREAVSYA